MPGWYPRNQKAPVNWELWSCQCEELNHNPPSMNHSKVHRGSRAHATPTGAPTQSLSCACRFCSPLPHIACYRRPGWSWLKRPVSTSRGLVQSSRLPHPPKSGVTHPRSYEQVSSATSSLRLEFLLLLSIFGQQSSERWVWIPKGGLPTLPLLTTLHKDFCVYYSLAFSIQSYNYYHGRKEALRVENKIKWNKISKNDHLIYILGIIKFSLFQKPDKLLKLWWLCYQ